MRHDEELEGVQIGNRLSYNSVTIGLAKNGYCKDGREKKMGKNGARSVFDISTLIPLQAGIVRLERDTLAYGV